MSQELNKFAWPGCYTILYLFTEGNVGATKLLTLCWECATKATKDEDYKQCGSFIHWEGESLWCDDCGVELPSEYGNPNEEENEPQVDAGELACETVPTVTHNIWPELNDENSYTELGTE